MNLFTTLPERGSVLYGNIADHFTNINDDEIPARMLELARYYYYGHSLVWFVWGTRGYISGTYAPKLQQIINAYNDLPSKDVNRMSGYFALMWAGVGGWAAYYTPDDDDESIDVRISEEDAVALAQQFYENGFIDLNNLLNGVFNILPFLFNELRGRVQKKM